MPKVEPKAQLAYRNAMIAEAQTDYYLIVDGDELWSAPSLKLLEDEFSLMCKFQRIYGVVRRIEVREDLKSAYSVNSYLPHHRVYHRTATWSNKHPGEVPRIPQRPDNEFKFSDDVKVFHFHNTLRSPHEDKAYRRIARKSQGTYHRGTISDIDLLKELPILKEKGEFPVNPELTKLWAQ
ncbi:MAG: hypothetical protein ACXABY_13710, partial [Candidatus Thorarchaeota archaeon]|jgi:hypothetical protein